MFLKILTVASLAQSKFMQLSPLDSPSAYRP